MDLVEIMPEIEVAEGMLVRLSAYENPDRLRPVEARDTRDIPSRLKEAPAPILR